MSLQDSTTITSYVAPEIPTPGGCFTLGNDNVSERYTSRQRQRLHNKYGTYLDAKIWESERDSWKKSEYKR